MSIWYEHRTASEALPVLLSDLLEYGEEVDSRNGRVKELLNPQITITDPVRREVLSINRKANVFAQIAETMWVLSGRDDIEWLSAYLPRAPEFSDDGTTWSGGYGPRMRSHFGLDQLKTVIDLLRKDPLTRRAVVAIYDPEVDAIGGKDVPCNDFLQFQSRGGRLHLTVTVRSNDVMWGWSGINAFEWSVLLEIVASLLGIGVGSLVFNIGNLHLYGHHWDRAKRIEHEAFELPLVRFNPDGLFTELAEVDSLIDRWFIWEALCRKGEATLEMLDDWEDPLFKMWAAAIAYYWQRSLWAWDAVQGTALAVAMARAPHSVLPEPVQKQGVSVGTPTILGEPEQAFYTAVTKMHAEKHRSYGDSWKKRGEMMSILPNIARKMDRLGVGDSFDSSADTVVDLWVYLAKYRTWLNDNGDDDLKTIDGWLMWSFRTTLEHGPEMQWEQAIPRDFDTYLDRLSNGGGVRKSPFIERLLVRVAPIARDQWYIENEYRPDLGQ